MSTYFIIGADNREYGPASAEEVGQWIREHRADATTKIRLGAQPSWTLLGQRPEFAEILAQAEAAGAAQGLAASAADPTRPMPGIPGAGERLAAEVLARGYDLQIGDCFARGWELLVGRFGLLAGATALVYLLSFGIWSIPGIGVGAVIVLSFVLLGGLNLLFLKELRGEPVDVGVVFAGFNTAFLPLLLAGTVATSLVLVGGLLCLVPGIYLLVAWHMFGPLLVLDKGLDFWQALECSRRVVTRHWWVCGGLLLLGLLAVAAGLLACLVGAVVTLPLATAAMVVAYEDIFGPQRVTRPEAMLPQPEQPMDAPDQGAQTEAPGPQPDAHGNLKGAPAEEPIPGPGEGPRADAGPEEIRSSKSPSAPGEKEPSAETPKAEELAAMGEPRPAEVSTSRSEIAEPTEAPRPAVPPTTHTAAAPKSAKGRERPGKGVKARPRKKG